MGIAIEVYRACCEAVEGANCGEIGERAEGSWLRLCPRCGFPLQVSGGGELDVLQVSFEAPDSDEASTPERTAS
ncbi:MAG: hypothetical protein P8127_02960 [Acidobacteriota bacterium]